jgi:exonuclease VII small subunit|tara:strand:- start:370 stop:603 length:234 start_codon:yes stop_codon:yes gene_type:complete
MKNENIPADIKSKSLKDARDEISEILNKLEGKDVDLVSSINDYQRLIQLNKYIDLLFKKKVKEISLITQKEKKSDKK